MNDEQSRLIESIGAKRRDRGKLEGEAFPLHARTAYEQLEV